MSAKLKVKDIKKNFGINVVKAGFILGSGLSNAIPLNDKIIIDYNDIDGFNIPSVTGHSGKLVIGTIKKKSFAILSGRTHFYENGKADTMRTPIKILKDLGVEKLVLTNAAGSLRSNIPTGSIMIIKDHINFCLLYTSPSPRDRG